MLSRILILKNLSKVCKHVLVTHQLTPKHGLLNTSRNLHVKTYDKDVRPASESESNKISNEDKTENANDNNVFPNGMRRKYIENNAMDLGETLLKTKNNLKVHLTSDTAIVDDPDVFGNASEEHISEDEGDLLEEEYISRPTRHSKKLQTRQYAALIKDHLNNHRLKEAIGIVETRMLKEDRVKPESYIYNLLISGCAKAGYTRKAFQLFTKMRQRGLKVKESTYTSLFNACANAPSRENGLTRAIRLRESLLEKGYEFNVMNYNAMIKTFGHWGDVKTAYILADEMRDKNLPFTAETFNFLLQACAGDNKHGFRHCLLTWHKMLAKNIQPDYYSFKTVLRCVRDCGFGDLNEMESILQQILMKNQAKLVIKGNSNGGTELISPSATDNENSSKSLAQSLSVSENSVQITNESVKLELPNLLAPVPHLGSMVSLSEVQKPHERFLLLGGLTGFLELMKSRNITPNIQILTAMLEVIPPTNTAEKQLLTYIRKIGLKADIDFFNILIKKRAMRFDYEGGKEVLSMIHTAGLYPDIVTYGVLALGCTTIESSRELLERMRCNGLRMNIQILGAMLRQGCFQKSFPYICEIIQISLDENIKPNEIFLKHLNNFYLQCARAIDARHPNTKNKAFKKEHKKFCDKYRIYQEEHGITDLKFEDAIKKIKDNPYNQYKEESVEGMEPLKNEKLSRKNKLRKYTKKIKIQTLKGDDELGETDNLGNYTIAKTEVISLPQVTPKEFKEDPHTKKINLSNPFRIS